MTPAQAQAVAQLLEAGVMSPPTVSQLDLLLGLPRWDIIDAQVRWAHESAILQDTYPIIAHNSIPLGEVEYGL